MFFGWCAEIAHEFGAFHAIFSGCGGFGLLVTILCGRICLRKISKPVWAIGPVLVSNRSHDQATITPERCKHWLDTKPMDSVLYISFGSQNVIPASQMLELALALEASGRIFIWVVRPPIGFDINMEFKAKEWLPVGFEERIEYSKRGLLVRKWAPQYYSLAWFPTATVVSCHCKPDDMP
ncbi:GLYCOSYLTRANSFERASE [Salix koriyanagi]|uniref:GLYCOSYLTRANSFERASE n=1 Tax=Salix koriyanagi TaxID=2511006 RepID=A0A9Q0SZ59_9ROSI|nr:GLYCOSYLTRANSFERASE [Salix koriyanagi]